MSIVALIFAVLAVFPTGDRNSGDVTEYQPVKLAAMEGLFATTHGAPLAIIGMPDTAHARSDRSDLRAGYSEFSRLRKFQRQRQRPRCVRARAVAAGRTDVLRISRDGGARYDLCRRSRRSLAVVSCAQSASIEARWLLWR